jgi:hypothetical protein
MAVVVVSAAIPIIVGLLFLGVAAAVVASVACGMIDRQYIRWSRRSWRL